MSQNEELLARSASFEVAPFLPSPSLSLKGVREKVAVRPDEGAFKEMMNDECGMMNDE
ncbi:MAG: hypothetical protein WEB58_05715 [Planctomycetaceae bacterium]